MFCPRCEDEFREGFTRCPDCDVALVESLTAEPSEAESEGEALVTIARYFSPIEAHAHRMALEQGGLRAWVSDDAIGATYGVAIGTALQVGARDVAAARAILDAGPPSEPAEPAAPDDLEQPTEAGVAALREPAAPAQEEPSREDAHPRTFEVLELVGVLLVTSVYPIISDLLSGPRPPIERLQLIADIPWIAGLALIVWTLLRRGRQGPLAPMPMPRLAVRWGREILGGVLLFLGLYLVLQPVLGGVLDRLGVPADPSPWPASLRQPGMAAIYSLHFFFAAAFEEVVFRAYLISRLSFLLGKSHAWAVLAAAALFALTHGYPLGSTVSLFANGIGYGLVYVGSRSLPRLVAAHWLYNLALMNHYLHTT